MAAPNPSDFEKLGAFYLGRVRDVEASRTTDELVLLDSKDLTTHAVCVGMTGSGKTGLCIDLLEEAALDGVPAIAIDPKGDLGNLLLTFPDLAAKDFEPWLDDADPAAATTSVAERARAAAARWREGLAAWGQDGDRIRRLRAAAELVVWTPGSTSGRPLSVLRSFAPPAGDEDERRERVVATASSLLALAGLDVDPLRSREAVLLSTILDGAWREGRSLDLGGLIAEIRTPPFRSVGVVDVESFYPEKERFELALALNAPAASPGFSAWLQGEPLDAARLLRAPDGRPRLSIVSIAHLSDAERMFVVTLLLQEVVAWMRRQQGTGSLRALLFMDETFGYLPPTANPPSKTPLLTLLKQARAYGLGVVLATQNPVDLDYKALSNAGTWMLGRLQTERDKLRVLDGLEGASATAGQAFDRAHVDALLSGLGKRMFLLASAHEDVPVVFESRWAMSYLRGPLTRAQIQALSSAAPHGEPEPARADASPSRASGDRPLLPPGVAECFLPCSPGASVTYRPRLLARARTHHVSARQGVDAWRDLERLAGIPAAGEPDWASADVMPCAAPSPSPVAAARYEPLPAAITAAGVAAWAKSFTRHVHESSPLRVLRSDALDAASLPGETEADFRGRLAHAARERRDAAVEKVRSRHRATLDRLGERLRKAEQRVQVQADQASGRRTDAVLSAGGAILGAIFGRRGSALGRASTVARGFGRASQEKRDVERAEADVEAVRAEIERLEQQVAEEVRGIEASLDASAVALESIDVAARKADTTATVTLCWVPWVLGDDGLLRPASP